MQFLKCQKHKKKGGRRKFGQSGHLDAPNWLGCAAVSRIQRGQIGRIAQWTIFFIRQIYEN
jgi:hypothetical protein